MVWKGLGCAAALAVLGCGSAAFAAGDLTQTTPDDVSLTPVTNPLTLDVSSASAPASPTSLTPIMYALDPTSAGQWLEKNHLSITGFVEGGYWLDMTNDNRTHDNPTFVSFPGSLSNEVVLDQLDLTLSKSLDTTKQWDWGFTFEQGYGIDDAQIHSHGMLDNSPFPHPLEQYDIPQANVEFLLPVGTGLTLTLGKVPAFLGLEVINPTGNAFYTHSYSFTFGIPLTNTGVWATYTFPKLLMGQDLTVTGGISRGWNQSTSDNNGAIDGILEAKGKINDKWNYVLNAEFGPEGVLPTGPADNGNYWTTLEAIVNFQASDELLLSADCVYGDAPHSAVTTPTNNAQWGGIAAYAGYKFDSYFTPNLRLEYYDDTGGLTTGSPVNINYYEATLNCQIHPMPNDNWFQWLQLRPEFRVDWSDHRAYGFQGGHTGKYSQVSFGLDAIMQF
jgi:putative OmpL-like beta-barrel porin-2